MDSNETKADDGRLVTGVAGTGANAQANDVADISRKDVEHIGREMDKVPEGVIRHPNLPGGQAPAPTVLGQAPHAPSSPQPGSPAYGHNHDGPEKEKITPPNYRSPHVVVADEDDDNDPALQGNDEARKSRRAAKKD